MQLCSKELTAFFCKLVQLSVSKSYKSVVTTIKIGIIKKEIHYYILCHYVAFVIYLAFIGNKIFLKTVSNLFGRVFENYK